MIVLIGFEITCHLGHVRCVLDGPNTNVRNMHEHSEYVFRYCQRTSVVLTNDTMDTQYCPWQLTYQSRVILFTLTKMLSNLTVLWSFSTGSEWQSFKTKLYLIVYSVLTEPKIFKPRQRHGNSYS